MEIVINIILYSIEMLIAYMYSGNLYSKKRKTSIILLNCEILYLSISVFNILFNNIIVNIVSFILINIVIFIINYNISIRQSIIHSIILTAIMLVSECIVTFSATALFDIAFLSYRENFTVLLIESSLSKIFYTILCFVLTKNKKVTDDSHTKIPFIYLSFHLVQL